ncbi:MAG: helix-turn-helix transcriptional regulator [Lachnospiraceae bacterium]
MNFSEKIKNERIRLNLTQKDVADKLGIALRTYTNYEHSGRHPRNREIYHKLAELFGVDVNYLLTENEEFIADAHEKYGSRGAKQAKEMVEQFGQMFAGGELSEEDMDGVMRAMQELYWDAKQTNKKYTPKKYLNTDK